MRSSLIFPLFVSKGVILHHIGAAIAVIVGQPSVLLVAPTFVAPSPGDGFEVLHFAALYFENGDVAKNYSVPVPGR